MPDARRLGFNDVQMQQGDDVSAANMSRKPTKHLMMRSRMEAAGQSASLSNPAAARWPPDAASTAAAAAAADVANSEQLSLLGPTAQPRQQRQQRQQLSSSSLVAAAATAPPSSSSSSSRSSSSRSSWQDVVRVAQNRVVLYAGSWRILHDIPG
jgi:hypothetical protein